MNNIQIFEAIGLVDDELLKQCSIKPKKKRHKQLLLVACIMLPIIVVFTSRFMILPKSDFSEVQISQELLTCFIQINQIEKDGFSGTVITVIDGVHGSATLEMDDIYVAFNSDTTFTNSNGEDIEYDRLDINEWEKKVGDIVAVSFNTYSSEKIYASQVSETINDLIYRNVENSFTVTISDTEKAVLNWNEEITVNPSSTIYLYNISEEELCNITDLCEKGEAIPLEKTGTYIVLQSINNDFAVLSADYYNIMVLSISNNGNNIMYLGGDSIVQ